MQNETLSLKMLHIWVEDNFLCRMKLCLKNCIYELKIVSYDETLLLKNCIYELKIVSYAGWNSVPKKLYKWIVDNFLCMMKICPQKSCIYELKTISYVGWSYVWKNCIYELKTVSYAGWNSTAKKLNIWVKDNFLYRMKLCP